MDHSAGSAAAPNELLVQSHTLKRDFFFFLSLPLTAAAGGTETSEQLRDFRHFQSSSVTGSESSPSSPQMVAHVN